MTKPTFDMDGAIKALREGKDLSGKDGILTPLIKQLTEAAMQAGWRSISRNKKDTHKLKGSRQMDFWGLAEPGISDCIARNCWIRALIHRKAFFSYKPPSQSACRALFKQEINV